MRYSEYSRRTFNLLLRFFVSSRSIRTFDGVLTWIFEQSLRSRLGQGFAVTLGHQLGEENTRIFSAKLLPPSEQNNFYNNSLQRFLFLISLYSNFTIYVN